MRACRPVPAGRRRRFAKLAAALVFGLGSLVSTGRSQDFSVLHNFSSGQGGNPWAGLIEAPSGVLYGTTQTGGASGKGAVFALTPIGGGAFSYTEVHAFSGTDGETPAARLLLANDGNLYGSTNSGGEHFRGTVFRIDSSGQLTTLRSFSSEDGEGPHSHLLQGPDGAFYGTAASGGVANWGTMFRIDGDGVLSVLHDFPNDETGGIPVGGVALGPDDAFYGVTLLGGAMGNGTVYRIDALGSFSVIHDFVPEDGGGPSGGLMRASDGLFYGTTQGNGANGLGTIFRVDAMGALTVIHDFAAGDGRQPPSDLLDGGDGYLYGVNSIGTNANDGTVFRVTPAGSFQVIHTFVEAEDGPPEGRPLLASDGKLYGTAFGNPFAPGEGQVYRLNPDGTGFETVHPFSNTEPSAPNGGFLLGSDGLFYGTSGAGGAADAGTVYRFDPANGVTVLHAFTGADGNGPGVLVEGADHAFYGSAFSGGAGATPHGTVFRVDGLGAFSVLHTFDLSDGAGPSGLAVAPDGTLFGSTFYGGPGPGSLFHIDASLMLDGIHDFDGSDGAGPGGPLVWWGGAAYGVTYAGGVSGAGTLFRLDEDGLGAFTTVRSFTGSEGQPSRICLGYFGRLYGVGYTGGGTGFGGLFRLDTDGRGRPIHSFTSADGGYPTGLILGIDGNFYGVTSIGGSGFAGTLFRADPSGHVVTLHEFSGADGGDPLGGLVQAPNGDLYGTTAQGGLYGGGTIFRFTPPSAPAVWKVDPSSGPAETAAPISIMGAGFQEVPTVSLGGEAVTSIVFQSSGWITGTAPALAAGTLSDLALSNPDASAGGYDQAFMADFLDVPQADLFHAGVESVFRFGVTAGCGAGFYCRNAPTTRAQMAVFLLKAKLGPSYTPPPATGTLFSDVPADGFAAAWIEDLALRGIAGGCGGGNFCPNDPVTRAQMAALVLKDLVGPLYVPPAATGTVFDDVPADAFAADWIEDLARRGITAGCGGAPPLYCPDAANTRGQMAVFLTRTFQFP